MKVLFLVPRFSGGGAEFVARQWMEYLVSKGDDVVAATTGSADNSHKPVGVMVHHVGASTVPSLMKIRALIRAEGPDVVLALMPYWNLLALVATRGLRPRPKVVISGRNMVVNLRETFGLSYRIKQVIARRIYKRADEFVAISHPVAAEAIALYKLKPSKVSVVLNPSLKTTARQATRPTNPSEPIAIVAPARLVRQKRPHLVIEAVAAFNAKHQMEAEAHFFGIGPLAAPTASLADEHGVNAHFHGWIDNWAEALPANSIVLLPSLSEGFGNVLVEAARSGVPSVVSSRALGVADALVPGVTGVLVVGESAAEFADGIMEALALKTPQIDGWLQSFTKESSGSALRTRLLAILGSG